jgi:hypothetical protein
VIIVVYEKDVMFSLSVPRQRQKAQPTPFYLNREAGLSRSSPSIFRLTEQYFKPISTDQTMLKPFQPIYKPFNLLPTYEKQSIKFKQEITLEYPNRSRTAFKKTILLVWRSIWRQAERDCQGTTVAKARTTNDA